MVLQQFRVLKLPIQLNCVKRKLRIGWLFQFNIKWFLFSLSGNDTPGALYTILPEKKVERFSGQLMGSSHVYDLSVGLIFKSRALTKYFHLY